MPTLRLVVSDPCAGRVAALSFLEHHPGWSAVIYTTDSAVLEALPELETRWVADPMAALVEDSLQGGISVALSQHSLTRGVIPQLDGDRPRDWHVAIRPRRPLTFSNDCYAQHDPDHARQLRISGRYFTPGVIGFNGETLRRDYPGLAVRGATWLDQLNAQLAGSHMGLLPGRVYVEPEVVAHRHVTAGFLLRHQSRLYRSPLVHYPDACLPWKVMSMRLLMQLDLEDYLAACIRYGAGEQRIAGVERNLVRYRNRFGKLGRQLGMIYQPALLD